MSFESRLEACDYAFVKRVQAAQEAIHNQILYLDEHWGRVESSFKKDASRITPADKAISRGILEELKKTLPDDTLLTEEADPCAPPQPLNAQYAWLLDPIDGTNNYALAMPQCAISLALLKKGVPVYGIVYDMSRDLIIQGGPRLGTYEGSRCVQASTRPLDAQSIIAINFPLKETWSKALEPTLTCHKVRSLGSAVLHFIYAISGKIDGAVGCGLKLWDLAACHALAEGAGADMCFISENPFPLKHFDVNNAQVSYYFGSPSFCKYFKTICKDLS